MRTFLSLLQVVVCLFFALTSFVATIAQEPQPNSRVKRTRAEVEELIKTVGRTPPDWYANTQLNYPATLDLSWSKPEGPWNNQKNLNQFIWDVINPNPHRWREGVKLMHTVASQNRNNKEVLHKATNTLGHLYGDCLEDFARAAFWWKVAGDNDLELAYCYWKLGCNEMTSEILKEYDADRTRNASIIKMWADMGEFDKALELAEKKAANGAPDSAYLAAGDACRMIGRYEQALSFYEKSAAATDGGRDIKRNIERAKASIEAIQLIDRFDLKRASDGSYTSDSRGYEGAVHVRVDIKQGRIDTVKVTQHREKQFYSAMTDTPRQILEKQSIRGVDATSGATITSEAIINATAKAVARAVK